MSRALSALCVCSPSMSAMMKEERVSMVEGETEYVSEK